MDCLTTKPKNVPTQDIRAEIRIIATDSDVANDATIEAYLYLGSGGSFIEISSGDSLQAYLIGVAYGLSKISELFGVYYAAS